MVFNDNHNVLLRFGRPSSSVRGADQHLSAGYAPGVHAADLMIYLRERLAEKRLAGFTRSTTYYPFFMGSMCRRMCYFDESGEQPLYVLTWLEV